MEGWGGIGEIKADQVRSRGERTEEVRYAVIIAEVVAADTMVLTPVEISRAVVRAAEGVAGIV